MAYNSKITVWRWSLFMTRKGVAYVATKLKKNVLNHRKRLNGSQCAPDIGKFDFKKWKDSWQVYLRSFLKLSQLGPYRIQFHLIRSPLLSFIFWPIGYLLVSSLCMLVILTKTSVIFLYVNFCLKALWEI